jgi:hypothetical protein
MEPGMEEEEDAKQIVAIDEEAGGSGFGVLVERERVIQGVPFVEREDGNGIERETFS